MDSRGPFTPSGQQSLSYPCVHCGKRRESKFKSPISPSFGLCVFTSVNPPNGLCVHACMCACVYITISQTATATRHKNLNYSVRVCLKVTVEQVHTLFLHAEIPMQAHLQEEHLAYANLSPGKIVKFIWS